MTVRTRHWMSSALSPNSLRGVVAVFRELVELVEYHSAGDWPTRIFAKYSWARVQMWTNPGDVNKVVRTTALKMTLGIAKRHGDDPAAVVAQLSEEADAYEHYAQAIEDGQVNVRSVRMEDTETVTVESADGAETIAEKTHTHGPARVRDPDELPF